MSPDKVSRGTAGCRVSEKTPGWGLLVLQHVRMSERKQLGWKCMLCNWHNMLWYQLALHHVPASCHYTSEGPSGPPGEFEEWEEWTECSRTCGGGRQARARKCRVNEEGDYMDCTGSLREIRDCQTNPCPGTVF